MRWLTAGDAPIDIVCEKTRLANQREAKSTQYPCRSVLGRPARGSAIRKWACARLVWGSEILGVQISRPATLLHWYVDGLAWFGGIRFQSASDRFKFKTQRASLAGEPSEALNLVGGEVSSFPPRRDHNTQDDI